MELDANTPNVYDLSGSSDGQHLHRPSCGMRLHLMATAIWGLAIRQAWLRVASMCRLRAHFMALAAPILEVSAQLSGRPQATLASLWAAGARGTTLLQDQAMSQQLARSWSELLAAAFLTPVQRPSKAAPEAAAPEALHEASLVADAGGDGSISDEQGQGEEVEAGGDWDTAEAADGDEG